MLGVYAAVTRATLDGKNPGGWFPEQKLTVAEAVEAYTMGFRPTLNFRKEKKVRSRPANSADMVLLSDDMFTLSLPRKSATSKFSQKQLSEENWCGMQALQPEAPRRSNCHWPSLFIFCANPKIKNTRAIPIRKPPAKSGIAFMSKVLQENACHQKPAIPPEQTD